MKGTPRCWHPRGGPLRSPRDGGREPRSRRGTGAQVEAEPLPSPRTRFTRFPTGPSREAHSLPTSSLHFHGVKNNNQCFLNLATLTLPQVCFSVLLCHLLTSFSLFRERR